MRGSDDLKARGGKRLAHKSHERSKIDAKLKNYFLASDGKRCFELLRL
jgi:hypothetical protein